MLQQIPKIYRRADLRKTLGVLLAASNFLSAVLLTGISGWFITTTALTGEGLLSLLTYNLFLPGAVIRMLAVARPLLGYAEKLYTHKITLHLAGASRAGIIKSILQMKKKKFIQFRSADLATRITGNVAEMDNFYLIGVLPWLSTLLIIGIAAAIMGFYLPGIAWLILLLTFTCGGVMPYSLLVRGKRHELRRRTLLKILQDDMASYLDGLRDLELFGNLKRQKDKMLVQIRELASLQCACLKKVSAHTLVSGFIIQLIFALSIWIMSNYGRLLFSNAEKVMVILILLTLCESLSLMPETAYHFAKTLIAGQKLHQISTNGEPVIKYGPATTGAAIVFKQVSFSYGHRRIFDRLSFELHQNAVTMVTGPNGTGKSTLLDLLAGLQSPDQGKICIGDSTVENIAPKDLYAQVAYMEQQPAMFDTSIYDNIALARTGATFAEVTEAAVRSGLVHSSDQPAAYLAQPAGIGGRNLSTGQVRMVALARIILKDAPVILLDEPTEGLSSHAEKLFLNLIRSWKGHKTILIVTHKSSLLAIADHHLELQLAAR